MTTFYRNITVNDYCVPENVVSEQFLDDVGAKRSTFEQLCALVSFLMR